MSFKAKNIYMETENHFEINIHDRNNELKGIALVSKDVISHVKKYNWSIFKSRKVYYVHSHIGSSKYIKLHRLIMKLNAGESELTVDHINRNGLDNRNENLRYADSTIQGHNKSLFIHNTSGEKGVSFYNDLWYAETSYKNQRFRKSFKSRSEAIEQRKYWDSCIAEGEIPT